MIAFHGKMLLFEISVLVTVCVCVYVVCAKGIDNFALANAESETSKFLMTSEFV
jgi:hypothetical protein